VSRLLREMTDGQRTAWMVGVVLLAVVLLFAAGRLL
jgi:hypothetical protein